MIGPVLSIYVVLSTPHLQPAPRRPSKPQHLFQEVHLRVGSVQQTSWTTERHFLCRSCWASTSIHKVLNVLGGLISFRCSITLNRGRGCVHPKPSRQLHVQLSVTSHPTPEIRTPLQNESISFQSVNPDCPGSLLTSNHQSVPLSLPTHIAQLDTVPNLFVPKRLEENPLISLTVLLGLEHYLSISCDPQRNPKASHVSSGRWFRLPIQRLLISILHQSQQLLTTDVLAESVQSPISRSALNPHRAHLELIERSSLRPSSHRLEKAQTSVQGKQAKPRSAHDQPHHRSSSRLLWCPAPHHATKPPPLRGGATLREVSFPDPSLLSVGSGTVLALFRVRHRESTNVMTGPIRLTRRPDSPHASGC